MTGDGSDQTEDAPLLRTAGGAFALAAPGPLGVAVSGGGDSLALLHLLSRVADRAALRAATIDHGLRPEARAEARLVGQHCARLGIRHEVVLWRHGKIAGNLQDQARRARYRLLGEWARGQGIGHVALGHTADDQAETFLMELAREAGLDGLSAMRDRWQAAGVTWHRPLLRHSRAELRAYLTRHGIAWAEDPSNASEKFTRIRARKVLATLAPLGIPAGKLAAVAQNLAQARQALDQAVAELAGRIGHERAGEVSYERQEFDRQPAETRRRLLIGALKWVSGAEYKPRGAELARLMAAVAEGRHSTLSGCRIRVSDADIRILREAKAVAGLRARPGEPWDGRWRLVGPGKRGYEVRALGAEGLKLCPGWRDSGASRAALCVTPAVWQGPRLIAAPLAGLNKAWHAEPVKPFQLAFTRH